MEGNILIVKAVEFNKLHVDPVKKTFLNSLRHLNGKLFNNTFLCDSIIPEVNFFEIPFDDAERVTNFYSKVFGLYIEKNTSAGFDYYFIHTKGDDGDDTHWASSYSGGMIKKREPADHTVIYVDVPSVEEYAKKVDENGGKILVQKTEVNDMDISFIVRIQNKIGSFCGKVCNLRECSI